MICQKLGSTGVLPDGVLVQVGVGRGALVTAWGQLVGRCPRALQIHQLRRGPCCQSCTHTCTAHVIALQGALPCALGRMPQCMKSWSLFMKQLDT